MVLVLCSVWSGLELRLGRYLLNAAVPLKSFMKQHHYSVHDLAKNAKRLEEALAEYVVTQHNCEDQSMQFWQCKFCCRELKAAKLGDPAIVGRQA